MKTIFVTGIVVLASQFAFAETYLNCSNRNPDQSGPIKGTTLVIEKEQNGELKGIMYPNCPVCMVMPTYIKFESQRYDGTLLVIEGKTHTLTVALESLLPTKTHPAKLVDLAKNKSTDFVCEQP